MHLFGTRFNEVKQISVNRKYPILNEIVSLAVRKLQIREANYFILNLPSTAHP